MIARGFKPVGWVAAVAGAALGCYMLSLNVAAERAELASIERQIIAAKQDIRGLQTELGTRGRLTQLEHWNADVLALAAPASKQFLQDEFKLASFTEPQQSLDERIAKVRMASAEIAIEQPAAKPAIATQFSAGADGESAKPMLRRASLVLGGGMDAQSRPVAPKPLETKAAAPKLVVSRSAAQKPAPTKLASAASAPARADKTGQSRLIGDDLIAEIGAVSRTEKSRGGAGAR